MLYCTILAVLEGDAPRPLDELEHLVRLQGAHDVRGALALELLFQRRLHPAGVVRLLDLLQEGRAFLEGAKGVTRNGGRK